MLPLESEIRDGMRIDWDTPIMMDDGLVLRADMFRPIADGKYPVIISYGPCGGRVTLHVGIDRKAAVLLPVIPPKG